MANKEEFKKFVKDNPALIKHVNNGKMSWQKFYEMFDLYGTSNDAWGEYLKNNSGAVSSAASVATGITALDALSWIKNVDLDSFQNGVSSLQRVIGLLQDFSSKDTNSTKEEYKPRPIYKHFED